ncbi:flagellar hook-associated protein FlgK [Anaeromicropila populeti]|uniref:Flagellar hook-associated protein 1 n=1 Tax=Anaeromicropila populeti TaxID=37658 RepID=A0A1I6HX17_9FIRM|nr:flagellar hook-associated protein FlgK [Anaeromicropila populeti]SFR58993.1 flagellar hook-associated protein 1 FlgK [Anaeromicropila populeti]
MPSTFFGLSISTSGLYASQVAMNTTSHNISNANTTGYTRQEASAAASVPISLTSSYGMVGTGVDVNSITQVRNEYYDLKYRDNSTIYGYYSTQEHFLLSIEDYFKETNSEGLTATFSNFSEALSELQKSAGDTTMRTQTASMAEGFTEFVNYLGISLQTLQKEANSEIKNTTDAINSIAEQIASLNKQINTIEMTGQNANDLRDSRNVLLDRLSEYVKITSNEYDSPNSRSTTFEVRIDGKLLVDNYEYSTLECVPSETKTNQCDVDGLYDVYWSDGQSFNESSPSLGGTLQALFELRDGNNQEVFSGNSNGTLGSTTLTITDSTCNDITKLNLPEKDGLIKVGNKECAYDSFDVTVDAAGNYTYTFQLSEPLATDVTDVSAQVGRSISFKGIPYYMNQLTEFARTYSSEFNKLHNSGEDLNGVQGVDFFVGTDPTTECDYEFGELKAGFSFSSLVATDAAGNVIKNANGYVDASYYNMTCLNFAVSKTVTEDPDRIVTCEKRDNGIEEKNILEKLVALKTDTTVFSVGSPAGFLETFTSDIGTDTKKSSMFTSSQSNILKSIDTQRMSISSVDTDEESMNLVRYQNAYNLSSKAIQTMNELYDVLINGLGI